MYAPFFGLTQEPFSIAPDPRFLFMSERHREALAHLLYGISAGGGFVLLTGEIGAGKTTVCRGFLEQVPATCRVAYVFNPRLTVNEMLRTVCDEFGVQLPDPGIARRLTIKPQVDALNRFLLERHAQGQQAVLVIDEAQSLTVEVLEQLRLLTNLETAERKLLQIILIGQPELRDKVARPELEQLAQRVIARYHLEALSADETPQYIRHRLAVAGPHAPLPFDVEALSALHRISGGVPRRINLLADRALLGAFGMGQQVATRAIVDQAAREVFGSEARNVPSPVPASLSASPGWWRPRVVWMVAGALALGALALLWVVSPVKSDANSAAKASLGASTPSASPASAPANSPPAGANVDLSTLMRAAPSNADPVWRELALRWNVSVAEGEACRAVPQAGLACYTSAQGGLPLVRQLARPGLVALRSPPTATVYAQLLALNDERATLQVGQQIFSLTLAELATVWRGEFSTLWRVPPGWQPARDNLEDPAVRRWLLQRLPEAPAAAADPGSTAMREKLRVLQVAKGWPTEPAGLPVTLMQLQRSSGAVEPALPGNLPR